MRDNAQLSPPGVAHDPFMDAARVTIPAFFLSDALDGPVNETQAYLPINTTTSALYPSGRVFKIGREILTVIARVSATEIHVTRGTYGTTPEAHATGAFISHATNSLKQQARFTLGTEDGHTYLFTWDGYWTESFLGLNFKHKAFQFTSGGPDDEGQIWLEPSVIYSAKHGPGYVGEHDYRWYNTANKTATWAESTGDQVGPGTLCDPDEPQTPFPVAVKTWHRFWLFLEQSASDWDRVTAWAADENRAAQHVFSGILVSVRPTGKYPNRVLKFWDEFNSSTDAYQRTDQRDLVAFVRNFVALQDVRDPQPFLLRPVPGEVPEWRPAPPRDVVMLAG